MNIKEIQTESYITKSKLPDADYVINPYVGCPHKCIYCYAEFMKRFTGHSNEEWGNFIDIKYCKNDINFASIPSTATVLIGSVTDAYNYFEKKYKITRRIIEKLICCPAARVEILSKSDLVLRDIDLFKQFKNIYVGISMNTLDDQQRKEIEPGASSVQRRIEALKLLHSEGIHTYLFMSPIFPGISDCKEIVSLVSPYVDYICFENLNLRGAYLPRVMSYIQDRHPNLIELYMQIYWSKNMEYWENLKSELTKYCIDNDVEYKFYFYHDKIKKK